MIIRAYDNSYINLEKKEKDVFAINALKTLSLIKYVLEIEANVDKSSSAWWLPSIDDDRISLKAQVEHALKVLMRQMLIQKNGSIYAFLTDEEQEINKRNRKENGRCRIITKIAEMIYEDIFSSKKYQHPSFGGRYAFSFNLCSGWPPL